jgi:hypothetical protein
MKQKCRESCVEWSPTITVTEGAMISGCEKTKRKDSFMMYEVDEVLYL